MQQASSTRLSVGELIRRKRLQRGMTQRGLAAAAGRSPAYVYRVETGNYQPTVRCFASMAFALGMSGDEILLVIRAEARLDSEGRDTVTPGTYSGNPPAKV